MKILVCIHVKWSLVGVICKFLTLGLLFLNCSGPKDHIERADLKPNQETGRRDRTKISYQETGRRDRTERPDQESGMRDRTERLERETGP